MSVNECFPQLLSLSSYQKGMCRSVCIIVRKLPHPRKKMSSKKHSLIKTAKLMLDIRAVIVSHFLKRRHNTLFPTQDTVPKIFPVEENEKNIVFLVTNIEAYCLKVLYILPYGRTQCYCSYFGDTCGQKCLRTVHLLLMSYDNIFTRSF